MMNCHLIGYYHSAELFPGKSILQRRIANSSLGTGLGWNFLFYFFCMNQRSIVHTTYGTIDKSTYVGHKELNLQLCTNKHDGSNFVSYGL